VEVLHVSAQMTKASAEWRSARVIRLPVVAVLAALAVTGCAENGSTAAPASPGMTPKVTASAPTPGRFSQERSTACLQKAGAEVAAVPRIDARAKAVADLAQRNSVAVRMEAGNVLVVFAANDADAAFLADALRVSDDPYRMIVVDNAVLLYPPKVEEQVTAVRRCLR
jgi:hypothetical protein